MKKSCRIFLHASLFLLISLRVASQQKNILKADRTETESQNASALWSWIRQDEGKGNSTYRIILNKVRLADIWETEPEIFEVSVPLKDGSVSAFSFRKSAILDSGFHLKTQDGRILSSKEFSGLHYQIIPSKGCKIGGISFREGGLMAFIAVPESSISIGEQNPGSGKYYLSFDEDRKMPDWDCASGSLTSMQMKQQSSIVEKAAVSTICKTVRVYMEADRDVYTKSGNSLTVASNFITGLFNVVAQLYRLEGINIQLSGIFQWTNTDPYTSMTSSSVILSSFVANRPASSVNANLLHLVSSRSAYLGGIGYLGVLCNTVYKHGFSNIYYQYSALPAYSWSVYCISHELGHNFGSNHTQWCGWTFPNGSIGRIDSCYAGEGSCGTVVKPRKGTVMSYCHLNGGVDLNLGFGPLPQAAIRNGLINSSCISSGSCLGLPFVKADSLNNKNNSYKLTLSIPANHNATSWKLMEGGVVIQSGNLTGNTAFSNVVNVTGKANGTYVYSLSIYSASSSASSSPISVAVAVPVVQPPSGGICTANGLMVWFGSDGKMRFRFGISSPCTTYAVQVCRYNLSDPNVTPPAGAVPAACGIRNGMSAYSPSAAEWSQGFIERIADPQPANRTTPGIGSFWYSVDVTCNSGGSCTTTNRTRTYIFVPGI